MFRAPAAPIASSFTDRSNALLGISWDGSVCDEALMAIVEDLLATEDDFAWLKRPDFIWRDGPDDEVRIRSDSFCLNGSPTLNRFLQQWHIDLLELALHKRCLTSALSRPREAANTRRKRDDVPRAWGRFLQPVKDRSNA